MAAATRRWSVLAGLALGLILAAGGQAAAAELHVVGLYGPRIGLLGRFQRDVDWPKLAARVAAEGPQESASPARQIWRQLPVDVQTMLGNPTLIRLLTTGRTSPAESVQRKKLGRAFEDVLKSKKFYDLESFGAVTLSDELRDLVRRRDELSRLELRWMNRLLLEAAFPKEVRHVHDELPEQVTVRVTATGEPVILALTAYESVRWKVEAAEGVKLEKIIVSGHGFQEITSPAVSVDEYVQEDALPGMEVEWFWAWETRTGDFKNLKSRLKALTGRELSTFQGQSRHDGQPIVIDGQRGRLNE